MKTAPAFNQNRFTSILRMASAGTLVFVGAAMALFAAKPSAADAPNGGPKNGVYIVQMKASPAISYTGDIHGYNATKPGKGEKVDPLAANTLSYVNYLQGTHHEAIRKV